MCRWHTMNRREKCRCISLILVALLAIAGVVAMTYGGVQMWRVSKDAITADGNDVAQILDLFVKCQDVQAPTGAWSSDVVSHAMKFQCNARQLPARVISGFAAGFMILALLCAPCAFKKDKMFGFTLWSTLAIATILVSVTVVSVYALPAAAQMAPDCSKYDQATIQELQNLGVVCLKGVEGQPSKTTALKWMCKLHTFYAGAAVSVASLLLLFMCKHCCCCNPSASCCSSQAAGCGSGAGSASDHPCPIRRAVHKFKSRFCRRSEPALSSSVDRDDGVPVSAPSYYQVTPSEAEGVSEDAGAGGASPNYYGVN